MNEKIKKIFSVIGTFFVGIVTALVGFLLHNRRTTERITNDDTSTEELANDTERGITNAQSTANNIEKLHGKITERAESAEFILKTIREKQKIKDD